MGCLGTCCEAQNQPVVETQKRILGADPDYAGSGSINPVGIIFWIVHGFSILSMAAF